MTERVSDRAAIVAPSGGRRWSPAPGARILYLFALFAEGPGSYRVGSGWRVGDGRGALDEVRAALDDDLDTPAAVAAIDAAAARGEGISVAAALLGVDLQT